VLQMDAAISAFRAGRSSGVLALDVASHTVSGAPNDPGIGGMPGTHTKITCGARLSSLSLTCPKSVALARSQQVDNALRSPMPLMAPARLDPHQTTLASNGYTGRRT